MKIKFTSFFYCLFFLFIVSSTKLAGQASFSATVSPAKIGIDETFELRLMVDNAGIVKEISPPDLKQFLIVAGPVRETGTSIRNGIKLRESGISYILKPYKPGKYTIGQSQAKADNKILKSESLSIEVVKESSINTGFSGSSFLSGYPDMNDAPTEAIYDEFILKKEDNIPDKINKNLFIKVDVSKTSCYVGEPVMVTYKMYTRLKTESNFVRNPSFAGFSVIDLPLRNGNDFTREKLNGRDYNVYTLRKSQLYPLQAGEYELDSAEVDNTIRFIKEEYVQQQKKFSAQLGVGLVSPDAIHTEKLNLFSKPLVIKVDPLPMDNKPENYKGIVGQFTVLTSLEKNAITTDETGKLKLMITGEGNFMMVNQPEIKWPTHFEFFEPVTTEELNKETVPISGIKYFEYPFIVKEPGDYMIPPVVFNYFNAKEKSYKTVTTDTLFLKVVKGTGKPLTGMVPEKPSGEQLFEKIFTHRWWVAGILALLILSGLFFWIKREMKKEPAVEKEEYLQQENNATQKDQSIEILQGSGYFLTLGQAKEFYQTINKEWQQFLSDRFNIPVPELNKATILTALEKENVAEEIRAGIKEVMEKLSWELYTPLASTGNMQGLYDQVKQLIMLLGR